MKVLAYKKQDFEVYITNSSLVIINTNGEYENHAHLTKTVDSKGKVKLDTAKALINIVTKKISYSRINIIVIIAVIANDHRTI